MTKSETLAEDYGFNSVWECMEETQNDGVSPGICVNEGCNYSTDVEPDCASGYCEECGTQSVSSILILEGLI